MAGQQTFRTETNFEIFGFLWNGNSGLSSTLLLIVLMLELVTYLLLAGQFYSRPNSSQSLIKSEVI